MKDAYKRYVVTYRNRMGEICTFFADSFSYEGALEIAEELTAGDELISVKEAVENDD